MALSKCLQDYSQKAIKSETIPNPSTYDRRKCIYPNNKLHSSIIDIIQQRKQPSVICLTTVCLITLGISFYGE